MSLQTLELWSRQATESLLAERQPCFEEFESMGSGSVRHWVTLRRAGWSSMQASWLVRADPCS